MTPSPGVIAARRLIGLEGSFRELVLYDVGDASLAFSSAWHALDQKIGIEVAQAGHGTPRATLTRQCYRQILSSLDPYRPPGEAQILRGGAFFEAAAELALRRERRLFRLERYIVAG
jgi:hypothetical protein